MTTPPVAMETVNIFDGKGAIECREEDSKNVTQSKMLQELKSVIREVIQYFQEKEPECYKDNYAADYRDESHDFDHENFLHVSTDRFLRVKTLVDFKPTNDDELGFNKNQIITITSMKDEHCWVGELNGRSGWFPSKFVKTLDERSKKYSRAGDGFVNDEIIHLIKYKFCSALSSILQHGLRSSLLLPNSTHIWQYIEEVSSHEIGKDYQSVISRLVLCKTFRLDDEGKVLTPEELLFRSIQKINQTHPNEDMNSKFQSFIAYALNEQVLHLWWEILCNCDVIKHKWYRPSSFVTSPAWIEIKCEFRVLSNFTFYLPDVPHRFTSNKTKENLRREVSEMLVKHHLFSWDL